MKVGDTVYWLYTCGTNGRSRPAKVPAKVLWIGRTKVRLSFSRDSEEKTRLVKTEQIMEIRDGGKIY